MFVCICGIISNGFLLVVFATDPLRCLRNISSGLILNLCIADFLTAIMLLVWTTTLWNWASDKVSKVIFCVIWFGYSASFLTIALLSLERYIVIRYIWSSDTIVTKKRTAYGIIVIWLMSGISFISLDLKNLSISMFVLSTVLEICVLVVIIFYIKIWSIRRRHARQQHRAVIRQEIRLTKVVFALIMLLVVTTMPLIFLYQLLHGLWLFCGTKCISDLIQYLPAYLTPLFSINFALNPAIYGWRLPKYRRSFATLCTIVMRSSVRQKLSTIVMYKREETTSSDVTATHITSGSCTSL